MVYESDFYTTRRPYTSSRPTITSYSVTRREVPWHKVPTVPRPSQITPCFTVFGSRYLPDHGLKLPGLGKGQTFHRNIPHIAHKQLVIVGPSAHSTTHRIKQSAYLAEIDRIYHKVRPCLAYQPTEDYLNSRSIVSFDDETRSIRAKTAEILKKIHTPIPRAQRPMPLPGESSLYAKICLSKKPSKKKKHPKRMKDNTGPRMMTSAYYSHSELPITERISSDNYIDRLLSANREVQHNVLTMSHYDEPARHYNSIGKGHLACVSFAGGRPISKRRNLASADDYIRDDIKVLSHYGRFRAAANGVPHVPDTEYAAEYSAIPHRPPTKSTVTGSWKSNAPHKTDRPEKAPDTAEKEHHIKAPLVAGEEFDSALERKKKRREAVEAAAYREAEEEKRRKEELLRQEELAQQAALERQEELERRARQEEEAQRLKEEEEIIARENAERLAAEKKAQAEAEKKAKEEAERKEKEEAERLAKEEEERKAKEEAEKLAKEEEERKAKEEAERKAKEEEERKAKEEAERLAKEEEERKAKEEAERLAKEEEERKAKEEAERLAKEEEERKAKEEAERLAKEEEERKAKEEEERLAAENESAEPEKTEEESGPEPVVEEPQSPEDQPAENTEAAEEVEEEEEEE